MSIHFGIPGAPFFGRPTIFTVTLTKTKDGMVNLAFSDGRPPRTKTPMEAKIECARLQDEAEELGGDALIHDYTNEAPADIIILEKADV